MIIGNNFDYSASGSSNNKNNTSVRERASNGFGAEFSNSAANYTREDGMNCTDSFTRSSEKKSSWDINDPDLHGRIHYRKDGSSFTDACAWSDGTQDRRMDRALNYLKLQHNGIKDYKTYNLGSRDAYIEVHHNDGHITYVDLE